MIAGSDEITLIRWYFAPPGAKALPFATAFGHPAWESNRDQFDGPGCFWTGAEWRSCHNFPGGAGTGWIGTAADFQNGFTAATVVGDTICGAAPMEAHGGAAAGGSAGIGLFEVAAAAAGGGSPTVGTSAPRVLEASACGCGEPAAAVRTEPTAYQTCGCGSSFTHVTFVDYIYLYSTVCGCGVAESTATKPILAKVVAAACGCGRAETAVVLPAVTAAACGCGRAETAVVLPAVTAAACGCGRAETAVVLPAVSAAACGCGRAEASLAIQSPRDSVACGCGSAATAVNAISTVCCAGTLLPSSLLATITPASGCECMAGAYALNYVGNNEWKSGELTVCGDETTILTLACDTSTEVWEFVISCINNSFLGVATAVDCTAAVFTFAAIQLQPPGALCGFCDGSVSVKVTANRG